MLLYFLKILLNALIITILIELLVAFIIRIKDKKDYLNIILVNILTNPLLNALLLYININIGLLYRNISVYILEIIIVFIEGYIYKKYIKYNKINPYLLSLILNLSSFLLGNIINLIIY